MWNAAEAAEHRKNSVVAREIQLALPHELGPSERRRLSLMMAHLVSQRFNVAVDLAIHPPGARGDDRNHHAHLLFTTREVDERGAFGAKTRTLDVASTSAVEVSTLRAEWGAIVNSALAARGYTARVDHRSQVRQMKECPTNGERLREVREVLSQRVPVAQVPDDLEPEREQKPQPPPRTPPRQSSTMRERLGGVIAEQQRRERLAGENPPRPTPPQPAAPTTTTPAAVRARPTSPRL